MKFERGKDTKEAMEIGLAAQCKGDISGIYMEASVNVNIPEYEEDIFTSDIVSHDLAEMILEKISKNECIKEMLTIIFLKEIEKSKPSLFKTFGVEEMRFKVAGFGLCFITEGGDKTHVLENHFGSIFKFRGKYYRIPEDYEI